MPAAHQQRPNLLPVIPEHDIGDLDFNDLFQQDPPCSPVATRPAETQQLLNRYELFAPTTAQPSRREAEESLDDCFEWFLYPFK